MTYYLFVRCKYLFFLTQWHGSHRKYCYNKPYFFNVSWESATENGFYDYHQSHCNPEETEKGGKKKAASSRNSLLFNAVVEKLKTHQYFF